MDQVTQTTGNSPSDKELVSLVLGGNKHAFTIIIRNTEALVAQIIYKMIPYPEERKDLIQDVYLKAYDKLDGFRFQSKLSTWIAQIAYNRCLSWLERKKLWLPGDLNDEFLSLTALSTSRQLNPTDPDVGGTENQVMRRQLRLILQTEIQQLPPVYRTLITLYHQEDVSYEDICRITDLPEGTVKSYLFRARKMLKEKILAQYKKEAL